MRKRYALLAAASLTVGGAAFVVAADQGIGGLDTGRDRMDAPPATRPATQPGATGAGVTLPQGVTAVTKNDTNDIRNTLAKTTEAALTKRGFNDFVGYFVDADRNRIGKFANQRFDDLDGAIDTLSKQWREKYNQDFDMRAENALGEGKVTIVQGEITNPALLSNWPVNPTKAEKSGQPSGGQPAPGAQGGGTGAPAGGEGNRMSDRNLEKGRDVAVVSFPADRNLPELNTSLVQESFDRWRLDIPDNVDGPKLKENLKAALYEIGQNRATWPNDVNDAYRMVAHRVLMAAYDVNPSQGAMQHGGMNTGGEMQH